MYNNRRNNRFSMQQFVMAQATGYFLEKFMFQLHDRML